MTPIRISLTIACTATVVIAACARVDMPEVMDGQDLYMQYCAVCHGVDGTGTGPMSDVTDPAPADLTVIAARNGGTLPVAAILSKIDGYAQGGSTGPNMPQFGDLFRGDLVPYDTGDGVLTPTPRQLVALVEYLDSIQVDN